MTVYKFRFDFEVGSFVKSPCKDCEKRKSHFPKCIEACKTLDKIQRILAETRSSTRNS
ncbi:hypothetical protein DENIS_2171 [Desulfonema ishimotonii]|uniref:Uncharacterized protein n=2 Tax=Desulfonema ishimotonii TaxID=45657 RepID=A0A401FW73_9BACT|nr:hypothetical protein DENIS_2171 [Desulfonema ishimotonii]